VITRASGETRSAVDAGVVEPRAAVAAARLSAVVDGPHDVVHAISHLTLRALLAIAYVAYVSTLVGFGVWNRLIGLYRSSRVAPWPG